MSDDRTPRRVDLDELVAVHFPWAVEGLERNRRRKNYFEAVAALVEIAGALTVAPLLTDSARYALRVAGAVLGWESCLSCERPSPDLDTDHACPVCRGDSLDD